MKFLHLLTGIVLLGAIAGGQQRVDPAFYGIWTLNVAKSDFGRSPKPTAGAVNWGAHGWVLSIVAADGGVYADAVATDGGCALVGAFSSDFSCKFEVVAPRHLRFTLLQGSMVRRVGDIELLSDDITQTTHQITPSSNGPSYVEKTIWERQRK